MDFSAFQKHIKQQNWAAVYLLCGEEPHYVQQAEKELIKALLAEDEQALNLVQFEGIPAWSELAEAAESIPFFGDHKVILIRQCLWFKGETAPEKELETLFGRLPDTCQLVFTLAEKPDKRRRIFKWIEKHGIVMEAEPLKLRTIRPWLEAELVRLNCQMTPDAKEQLLASIGLMPQISLTFLEQELTKLALYKPGEKLTARDLTELLSAIPEVSVFALLEAMSKQDLVGAFTLLQEQLAAGVHALRLLALMARQIRLLLEMKGLRQRGISPKEAASLLKIHPYGAEKLSEQCRAFTEEQLKQGIMLLAEADHKLKTSQNLIGLEQVLLCLCKKK